MFGAGAGNIADMIARMKDVHKTKQNIKKYRELAKSYKYGKILHKQKQLTSEELAQIKSELKQYKIHQRNTFLLFYGIFIPISVIIVWGLLHFFSRFF